MPKKHFNKRMKLSVDFRILCSTSTKGVKKFQLSIKKDKECLAIQIKDCLNNSSDQIVETLFNLII